MNWNDLNSAWRCQDTPMIATYDLPSLQATYETRRGRQTRRFVFQNLAQAFVSLVVCAVDIRMAVRVPHAAALIAVNLVVIFASLVFFVTESIRIGTARLPAETPMLEKLDADIAELKYQRRLLLNVAKWYIAPVGLSAAFTVVAGQGFRHPTPLSWLLLAVFVVIAGVGFPFAVKLNRKTAQRTIEPRLAELEALRREMRG